MTSLTLKNNLKALAFCIGFFSLTSCKEHSIIKGGIVPEVDNIHTFQKGNADFDISFTNSLSDSLTTSNFSINSANAIAIGAFTDPFFGQTSSIAHFQITPYSSQFRFPDSVVIDSAVLVLPFSNSSQSGRIYGDTNSVNTWNIYKTGEKLVKSKTYFNNQQTSLGQLIGTATVSYSQFNDTTKHVIGSTNDTTQGQLRIKLANSFAQEIFNTDTNHLKNTTAFFEYFNGISIAPDLSKAQNLLAYFLLPSGPTEPKSLENARIEFHYHKNTDTSFISLVMRPTVCAYYSNLTNNYTGFAANNYINKTSDSILVQSNPGFKTDITINGLNSIPLSVINQAELKITVQKAGIAPVYLEYLKPLDPIYPVLVVNGKEQPLYERLDNDGGVNGTGSYTVDPFIKTETINGISYQQYRINIPRTIQQYILQGKDSITIRLKGNNSTPGMYRVLSQGKGNGSETNFKFNIIYTKK
ncbi:MAG TPA: hypothetical protein PKX92_00435 [Edaphocola sp.]|nr:hypothetical protein [Edaphocola sp.]